MSQLSARGAHYCTIHVPLHLIYIWTEAASPTCQIRERILLPSGIGPGKFSLRVDEGAVNLCLLWSGILHILISPIFIKTLDKLYGTEPYQGIPAKNLDLREAFKFQSGV